MPPADTASDFDVKPHQAAAKLKAFVSYSRQDTAFADELVAGLEYDGGVDVFLDRHNVHEAENWRERLGALIAGADIFVLLVSPASAGSDICKWEIEHAKALSKRIVPVLIASVEPDQVHPSVRSLNYVRFDEGRSFMTGLVSLRRALSEDLEWVREHTRLLMRAQEWDQAGRIENRLLSGPDIGAAKAWAAARPADAPVLLELHHDFISASEHAENARLSVERKQAQDLKDAIRGSRRALFIASALAVVASIAGGLAAWQWTIASRNEAEYFDYTEAAEARFEDYDDYIALLEEENRALAGLGLEANAPDRAPASEEETDSAVSEPGGSARLRAQQERIAELSTTLREEMALNRYRGDIASPPAAGPGTSEADRLDANARYIETLEAQLAEMRTNRAPAAAKPSAPRLPDAYEQKQMRLPAAD